MGSLQQAKTLLSCIAKEERSKTESKMSYFKKGPDKHKKSESPRMDSSPASYLNQTRDFGDYQAVKLEDIQPLFSQLSKKLDQQNEEQR